MHCMKCCEANTKRSVVTEYVNGFVKLRIISKAENVIIYYCDFLIPLILEFLTRPD